MRTKLFFALFFLTLSHFSFAQDGEGKVKNKKVKIEKPDSLKLWKYNMFGSLSTTQSAYMNWASGGDNSISLNGIIRLKFKYETKKFFWDNAYNFALGMNVIFKDGSVAKTDDVINLQTKAGWKFAKSWSLVGEFGFLTQFTHGYIADEVHFSSSFMAPGYYSPSIAVEYRPFEGFYVTATPLKGIITVVNDQVLANRGAYGNKAADYDANGNIINLGEKVRYQLGAYLSIGFAKELTKSIAIDTKLSLFSNYFQERPQNIDVNFDLLFKFKINSWLSSYLMLAIVYDDDVKIPLGNDTYGPRLQLKQILGLGLAYTFKNHDFK
ncbi:MAG: DUF3078 domain-containing protein [Crocinitomicaceae bacterium]